MGSQKVKHVWSTDDKKEYIYGGDTLVQSKDVEEMYLNMSITTSLII